MVILICSQKGGVGKTMIADEICFHLDYVRHETYSLYDLDQQGGLIHEPREIDNPDHVIVDTPGALQPELRSWADAADLVLIPTRPTPRDRLPYLRTLDIVRHRPHASVCNGWTRFRGTAANMEWIEPPLFIVPQSEAFVRAADLRTSVTAVCPHDAPARAITDLMRGIFHE